MKFSNEIECLAAWIAASMAGKISAPFWSAVTELPSNNGGGSSGPYEREIKRSIRFSTSRKLRVKTTAPAAEPRAVQTKGQGDLLRCGRVFMSFHPRRKRICLVYVSCTVRARLGECVYASRNRNERDDASFVVNHLPFDARKLGANPFSVDLFSRDCGDIASTVRAPAVVKASVLP